MRSESPGVSVRALGGLSVLDSVGYGGLIFSLGTQSSIYELRI